MPRIFREQTGYLRVIRVNLTHTSQKSLTMNLPSPKPPWTAKLSSLLATLHECDKGRDMFHKQRSSSLSYQYSHFPAFMTTSIHPLECSGWSGVDQSIKHSYMSKVSTQRVKRQNELRIVKKRGGKEGGTK